MPKKIWNEDAIRALGAFTNLATAADILNMSLTHAYEMARTGRFPFPLLRTGKNRIRVPVAPILAAAGYHRPTGDQPAAEDTTTPDLINGGSGACMTAMHITQSAAPLKTPEPQR